MARKQRPKTGEPRKTRQPFAIDKLPVAWRDHIIALRAKWLTWEQIEEETRKLDWDKLEKEDPELVLAHFADKRIPHSTLHRWYDVQVEQKLEEIEAESNASRAIAEKFAAAGYENLDQSVISAMRDVVFTHAKDSRDPERFQAALSDLALALTRFRRVEIAKERIALESKKLEQIIRTAEKETNDAVKKIQKGGRITADDIDRIRGRVFGLPPVQRSAAAGPAA
jgi:hypothetical protein